MYVRVCENENMQRIMNTPILSVITAVKQGIFKEISYCLFPQDKLETNIMKITVK